MTIAEAIDRIDSQKHNIYSRSEKIAWLSRLDALVKSQIIDTCEGGEAASFTGYHEDTDPATVLLVGAPFDEVYLHYLRAQMDYCNGEYHHYNNSVLMYQTAFDAFANHYRRSHMPKQTAFRYF